MDSLKHLVVPPEVAGLGSRFQEKAVDLTSLGPELLKD